MHSDFDILILKNTRTYYSQVLKHLMRTQIFVGCDMEKDHLLHASMQVQCTVTRFLTNTIYFYDEKHIIVKSNIATKYRIAVK